MARSCLTAVVIGGLLPIALGSGCDSGQRRRESRATANTTAPRSTSAGETPAPPARVTAIGATGFLAPELRRAFDHTAFEPAPDPGPEDWLAQHPEKPQSYNDYVRGQRNIPSPPRNVIYLLPVGTFPSSAPPLAELAEVVHAFFTLEVRVLPAVKVAAVTAQTRINQNTNKRQLFAPEVLGWLKGRVPDDAFGLLAVTTEDLYPSPSWNFVFGMASLRDRVGVQSLARQDPAFFGEQRADGWQTLARRRATWTLVHEVSHMFGLTHCTYWRCVVAGSNHQEESDRSPLHPCPVCLRKLHSAVKFDPVAREEALAAVFGRLGLDDEARWSAARANWIRTGARE